MRIMSKMTTTGTENMKGILWCSGILILLGCFAAPCTGRTTVGMIESETESLNSLSRDDDLSPSNSAEGQIMSKEVLPDGISEVQAYVEIPETGEFDDVTIRVMSIPRRSVSGKHEVARDAQWEEYRFLGSKWDHKSLTYKILNYPRGHKPEAVNRVISKAFNTWAKHTFLTGRQVIDGEADIVIRFAKLPQRPNVWIEGWATAPGRGCYIEFNDGKTWVLDDGRANSLLGVAVHEFGHALGIQHSNARSSAMSHGGPKLYDDDIKAIQLYFIPYHTWNIRERGAFLLSASILRIMIHLYGAKPESKPKGMDVLENNIVDTNKDKRPYSRRLFNQLV